MFRHDGATCREYFNRVTPPATAVGVVCTCSQTGMSAPTIAQSGAGALSGSLSPERIKECLSRRTK